MSSYCGERSPEYQIVGCNSSINTFIQIFREVGEMSGSLVGGGGGGGGGAGGMGGGGGGEREAVLQQLTCT